MSLNDKERRLIRLAVAFVQADYDTLRRLRHEAPDGEPDRAWRETALQAHLFCGFPRSIAGYTVLKDAGGLGELDDDEVGLNEDPHERGRELFARIYGKGTARVQTELASHHAEFAQWIEGYVYGQVLSRPGLTTRVRELLVIASIAALGHERQLAGHVRGSIACGATRADVDETLELLEGIVSAERLEMARRVVEHFAR